MKVQEDFVEIHGKHNERQVSLGPAAASAERQDRGPQTVADPSDREAAPEPCVGWGSMAGGHLRGSPLRRCLASLALSRHLGDGVGLGKTQETLH